MSSWSLTIRGLRAICHAGPRTRHRPEDVALEPVERDVVGLAQWRVGVGQGRPSSSRFSTSTSTSTSTAGPRRACART